MQNGYSRAFLAFPKRPEAKIRIFCLPYSGGSALVFRNWHRYLPKEVEVIGLQLPGRGPRQLETLHSNITSLMKELVDAIVPLIQENDKPFAIFGHSFGAVLTFELVHALRKLNVRMPAMLFISGRRAPQVATAVSTPIRYMSRDQLLEKVKELGGTPPEVLSNVPLMDIMLPIVQADWSIADEYQFSASEYSSPEEEPDRRKPFDVPIFCYGGRSDNEAQVRQMPGWAAHTTNRFIMKEFEGNHFFIQTAEAQLVGDIAEHLKTML